MEPSGPVSGPPAASVRAQPAAPPPLQIGQLLQAGVVESGAGRLLLSVGHRQFSAETSLSFRPGQVLTLEVRSLGERPVLKIVTALQESATAAAVRMLLPRYGASTPLLASLPRLASAAPGTLPPELADSARALLRALPDAATLSSARGVREAITASGSFLEHRLAAGGDGPTAQVAAGHDFKAGLLRLLAGLRGLAGGEPGQRPQAVAQRPAGVATDTATARPGAPPTTDTAQTSTRLSPDGRQTAEGARTAATNSSSTPAGSLPLKDPARTLSAATAPGLPRTAPLSGVSPGAAPGGTAGASPGTASTNPPPPFPGVVPVAQAPVKAEIELHRLGQLRLDLLQQQVEAALARVQLNQLASLPRDGDHRLVEWLFDIPVRRGDDIDLWSARLNRDDRGDGRDDGSQQPAWHAQLAFDLPGLGPMQARVSVQGERVSTHFRAERETTVPLVNDNLHRLRNALTGVGLEVGTLDCRPGSLAGEPGDAPDALIDEKA